MSLATRTVAPAWRAGAIFLGLIGGLVGGGVAAVVMTVAGVLFGLAPTTALNAFGAWLVRWLQTAAPDALDGFYGDATLGGIALTLLVGALCGAVFMGLLERFPDDQPLAWGIIAGAVLWLIARWICAPALNPLLVRTLDWKVLVPTCLAFGLTLGWWASASRTTAAEAAQRVERA